MIIDLDIPRLDTARLVMRDHKDSDFGAYAEFCASNRAQFLGGPFSRREALGQFASLRAHWSEHGFGRWIVADRSTDRPLGLVGLYCPKDWPEPEVAWCLFEGAEGQGIATEAARAARNYAYGRLGWTTAISLIAPGNAPSLRLAQRLGCRHEGQHAHPALGVMQVWRHPAPTRTR